MTNSSKISQLFLFQLFRCGPLIDLCRGPHIRHTGKVKAFAITKVKKHSVRALGSIVKHFFRTHQRIGKVIKHEKVYNVSMEYLFLIQNN